MNTQTWNAFDQQELKCMIRVDVCSPELFSLAHSRADGIRDFFEKPFNGLMYDDSPGSFVVGFASGTASLLKKSTDAALVSLIKITRSLSQFGAKISLDEEFYEDKQVCLTCL